MQVSFMFTTSSCSSIPTSILSTASLQSSLGYVLPGWYPQHTKKAYGSSKYDPLKQPKLILLFSTNSNPRQTMACTIVWVEGDDRW